MRSHRARLTVLGVLVLSVSSPLLAQSQRVSLGTPPQPGQVVRYRMTQEFAVDMAPDAGSDIPLPPAKMIMKTVLASTFRASDAFDQGRLKVNITYDEFSAEMTINGQPSPGMPPTPFLDKTFEATYSEDGAIVDMNGPAETEKMIEPIKQMAQQISGHMARVQLAVGETATVPLSMPLPVPLPGAGATGITGDVTVTLVSLDPDGADRIASCETTLRAGMAQTFPTPADGAGGGVTIDLKMSGTGTSKINVDRHVVRSQDGTITIDGTVSMTLPHASAPSRMTVRGSIKTTMAEVR
jgi:hypothetical protein